MLARTPHSLLRFVNENYPIHFGRSSNRTPRATMDFETRSVVDIKRVGAHLYAKHPTTEVLCLYYKLPGGDLKRWVTAIDEIGLERSPLPRDLFKWIEDGGLVEAHNAGFEIAIWREQCVKKMKWPKVRPGQWRCSAAKASASALPRDLEGAGEAMGLTVLKNKRGKELIRKYCKPKKLTKGEAEVFGDDAIIWNEDEGIHELFEYCGDDVLAEEALSEATADLSPDELDIWQITQAMNERGVMIDVELCHAALALVGKAKRKANAELEELTGIPSGTQREAVKEWLRDNEDLDLADTTAKTLEWYLKGKGPTLSKRAIRIITIVKEVNRTSTNKYKRMLECVDDDHRARENLVYCGAERTGRFSGRGIQFQNLPKGRFTAPLPRKSDPDFKRRLGLQMDRACADVKSRDLAWCEAIYGDVMNLVTSCLRGCIIAPPGKDLLLADYSAIEARCVLWEAGADAALQVFRDGKDIYCDMASGIYGREVTKDNARVISSTGATERDFGKVAILGLGYGMGWLKFLLTLRTYNIELTRAEVLVAMGKERLAKYSKIVRKKMFPVIEDYIDKKEGTKRFKAAKREASLALRALREEREEPEKIIHELALCKFVVDTYRARYPEVPAMWKAQEVAAIEAVAHMGRLVTCGVVKWKASKKFLRCYLPGGRALHYARPELAKAKTSWGKIVPSLRFMGRNTVMRWARQATYGGKITENITQAIARDIMAYAKRMVALKPCYDLLLSVHDEIITEVESAFDDKEGVPEFEELMSDLPHCYDGCPITAEGKRLRRYRK